MQFFFLPIILGLLYATTCFANVGRSIRDLESPSHEVRKASITALTAVDEKDALRAFKALIAHLMYIDEQSKPDINGFIQRSQPIASALVASSLNASYYADEKDQVISSAVSLLARHSFLYKPFLIYFENQVRKKLIDLRVNTELLEHILFLAHQRVPIPLEILINDPLDVTQRYLGQYGLIKGFKEWQISGDLTRFAKRVQIWKLMFYDNNDSLPPSAFDITAYARKSFIEIFEVGLSDENVRGLVHEVTKVMVRTTQQLLSAKVSKRTVEAAFNSIQSLSFVLMWYKQEDGRSQYLKLAELATVNSFPSHIIDLLFQYASPASGSLNEEPELLPLELLERSLSIGLGEAWTASLLIYSLQKLPPDQIKPHLEKVLAAAPESLRTFLIKEVRVLEPESIMRAWKQLPGCDDVFKD